MQSVVHRVHSNRALVVLPGPDVKVGLEGEVADFILVDTHLRLCLLVTFVEMCRADACLNKPGLSLCFVL